METKTAQKQDEKIVVARRRFLANCGKFAVVTPPVVSLMLATSQRNYAVASSCNFDRGRGGRGGSNGRGRGSRGGREDAGRRRGRGQANG